MYVFLFRTILEKHRLTKTRLFSQCVSMQGIVLDTLALVDSNGSQLQMPKDKNKGLSNLVWSPLNVAL